MALLPQLQENSFCTITVITAQTLTWAAAAGRRWMTIKPLPSDTPPGPRSSKQLSALPLQQLTRQPVCHLWRLQHPSLDLLLTCLFYLLPHWVFSVSKYSLSRVWLAQVHKVTRTHPNKHKLRTNNRQWRLCHAATQKWAHWEVDCKLSSWLIPAVCSEMSIGPTGDKHIVTISRC